MEQNLGLRRSFPLYGMLLGVRAQVSWRGAIVSRVDAPRISGRQSTTKMPLLSECLEGYDL